MSRLLRYAALVLSTLAALSQPAYAYLDAGTGSIILQAAMGAVACALVFGRTYLQRLKGWLRLSADPAKQRQPNPSE